MLLQLMLERKLLLRFWWDSELYTRMYTLNVRWRRKYVLFHVMLGGVTFHRERNFIKWLAGVNFRVIFRKSMDWEALQWSTVVNGNVIVSSFCVPFRQWEHWHVGLFKAQSTWRLVLHALKTQVRQRISERQRIRLDLFCCWILVANQYVMDEWFS